MEAILMKDKSIRKIVRGLIIPILVIILYFSAY